jgi:hypothetical protein
VLERRERETESCIEGLVEAQRAVKVVVCVVEGEADILGERGGVAVDPVGVCRERVEAWVRLVRGSAEWRKMGACTVDLALNPVA